MLIRPCSKDDLPAVINLYQACFAEPPWYEVFDPTELEQEYLDYLEMPDAVFLVAEAPSGIIGCTLGFDIGRKPDVRGLAGRFWEGSFYLAELFVDMAKRHQGVAHRLVRERFEQAKIRGYVRAVVRTSVDQPIIRGIYGKLGFSELDRQEVVSVKTVAGVNQKQADQRVILGGLIRDTVR